jgi:hypothetical protein
LRVVQGVSCIGRAEPRSQKESGRLHHREDAHRRVRRGAFAARLPVRCPDAQARAPVKLFQTRISICCPVPEDAELMSFRARSPC